MIIENVPLRAGFSWNRVRVTPVSPMQFTQIKRELERDKDLHENKWCRMNIKLIRVYDSYSINCTKEDWKEIRVVKILSAEPNGLCTVEAYRYQWLRDNVFHYTDEADETASGKTAYNMLQEKFNDMNNTTTVSLVSALSGKHHADEYFDIKKCVPVQIQYLCNRILGKVVDHVYKADLSSAFPTQIKGDLPTLKGCKRVKGRVEPTPEYPFAFYVRSHHIKIYGSYDSHELDSPFYSKFYCEHYDDTIKDKYEETILCKKMSDKYHTALIKAFEDCYNHRKEDSMNKLIMNATIGYFQKNSNPQLSFLTAIIILRNNIDMIRRCNQLMEEGNMILFIATDSIAWRGKYSRVACEEKYMGSFTYEAKEARFLGYSPNTYQWEEPGKPTQTKHSGVKREESAKLKFGELTYKGVSRKKYVFDSENREFCESINM